MSYDFLETPAMLLINGMLLSVIDNRSFCHFFQEVEGIKEQEELLLIIYLFFVIFSGRRRY